MITQIVVYLFMDAAVLTVYLTVLRHVTVSLLEHRDLT